MRRASSRRCRRPAGRRAGAARGGPPTTSAGSPASWRGWARSPACSAAATGSWPSRFPTSPAPSRRLRIEGSVLEAAELAALHRVLVAARQVQADLRRVARGRAARRRARAAAARHEARAPAGAVASTPTATCSTPPVRASRRRGERCRPRGTGCSGSWRALLRGLDASAAPADASVTVRGGRYVIPVRRDSRQPAGRDHPRRDRAAPARCSSSPPRRSSWAMRCARRRSRRSGRRCGSSAS